VDEAGAGDTSSGRRPTLLRLNAECFKVIGVSIAPSRTAVAVSDLAGRVLEREEFPTSRRPGEALSRVIDSVCGFASQAPKKTFLGVGVSVPGLVNHQTGSAVYIPHFKWRDWPIAEALTAASDLEALVDNDANTAALAESWFGHAETREARNLIMILVAEGIGTGIIFDGQVYHGGLSAAGEFGHMAIGQRGPVACSCGNYSCLEAFSSNRASLARYLKRSPPQSHDPCLPFDFIQLVERALGGERAATDALLDTAHYLGIGISNLIVGLSPDVVAVGGHIVRAWPLIEGVLRESTQKSVRRGLPSPPVVASALGDDPTLMGAISLVLIRHFESASLN
jgi:predicted NBD/HSP70 family sugar kinase